MDNTSLKVQIDCFERIKTYISDTIQRQTQPPSCGLRKKLLMCLVTMCVLPQYKLNPRQQSRGFFFEKNSCHTIKFC